MLIHGMVFCSTVDASGLGQRHKAAAACSKKSSLRSAARRFSHVQDNFWPAPKPQFVLDRSPQWPLVGPGTLKPASARVWGTDMNQVRAELAVRETWPFAAALHSRTLWQCAHAARWGMPLGADASAQGHAVFCTP